MERRLHWGEMTEEGWESTRDGMERRPDGKEGKSVPVRDSEPCTTAKEAELQSHRAGATTRELLTEKGLPAKAAE
jgi:hypothetical protein